MTTKSEINLKSFCGKESGRYAVTEPWVCSGWRYATDGKICVRVKTDETNSPEKEQGKYPPAHDLFMQARHDGCDVPFTYGVPMQKEIGTCPECGGCGRVGDVVECHKCSAVTGGDECGKCDGDGTAEVPAPVIIGGFAIKRGYYDAMSALENVKCGAPVKLNWPMPFLFDGGEGLVMPIPTKL